MNHYAIKLSGVNSMIHGAIPLTQRDNVQIELQHVKISLQYNGHTIENIQRTINCRLSPRPKIASVENHNSVAFLPYI